MPKTFYKNILVEIRHSLGRFLSIALIVMIGVAFFAGIKASAPDMKYSADSYFDKYNVQDIQLYSTLGLSKDDLEALKSIKQIKDAQATFTQDVITHKGTQQLVTKVISYQDDQKLNTIRLIEGRMPENDNECLAEASSATNELFGGYTIGDTITLETDDDTFKTKTYTVVGTAYNPNYLSYEKGTSSIGSGTVDTFIYVKESSLNIEYYTEIDMSIKGAKELNSYDDAYFDLVKPVVKEVENLANTQLQAQKDELLEKWQEQADDVNEELNDAKEQINQGKQQIIDGQNQLDEAKAQLATSKQQLDQGYATYQQNIGILDNIPVIEDALTKIQQAKDGLPQLQQAKTSLETQRQDLQAKLDQLLQLEQTIAQIKSQLEITQDPQLQATLDQLTANYDPQTIQTLQQGLNEIDTNLVSINASIDQANQAIAQEENLKAQYNQLLSAKTQLETSKAQLDQGYNEYNSGLNEINSNQQTLDQSKIELQEQENKYNEEAAKAQEELESAKQDILSLNGEWIVLDRDSHYSYRDYGACADRMDGISSVFPVFFFLVAALVCMTTMTRMVDEQRTEIGTLKALGYSKAQIMSKYLIYAFIAGGVGSILGCAIGMSVFPYVIYNAWNMLYNLESIQYLFQPQLIALSSGSLIGITLLATLASITSELLEVPSQLMRPKAAKAGKKVLLEKVPFIWNRLSFLHKVTVRNIFRYKKRFFMTIVGISGCSALLVAGFGIYDSVSNIAKEQYETIYHFNATATSNETNKAKDLKAIDHIDQVFEEQVFNAYIDANDKEQTITIHVVDDPKTFEDYYTLQDINTKETLSLQDDEILLSQKLSMLLDLDEQSTITLKDSDDNTFDVTIDHIFSNYVGHHIFMSLDTYKKLGINEDLLTSYLLKTDDQSDKVEQKIGEDIMEINDIENVTFYSSLQQNFIDMIDSLTIVIVVLVISAALLAFVVLYNLSNVNISERVREIATIKVLGFTNREVDAYVNRESIVLTIIGAAIGLVIGIGLHHLIMNLAEMEDVMFGRIILPQSYLISFAMTLGFAIIINLIMQIKLNHIKMVESLKAVE